jgi:AcrR family transcriptional regulator
MYYGVGRSANDYDRLVATPPVSHRRGRHAEGIRNDQLLLDAARDVFAADGASATVAAVAARAGLGIASLYRRYGSKTELLQRLCVLSMEQAIAAATDALANPDPTAALSDYIRTCVAQRTGAFAPLAGTIDPTPEMWALARKGRRLHNRIVRRAHEQGQLRRDITAPDISWMIEQFARTAPATDTENVIRTVHQRLLTITIDGLYATNGQALPGLAPTSAHYEQRWQTSPDTPATRPTGL